MRIYWYYSVCLNFPHYLYILTWCRSFTVDFPRTPMIIFFVNHDTPRLILGLRYPSRREGDPALWGSEAESGNCSSSGEEPENIAARWSHVSIGYGERKGNLVMCSNHEEQGADVPLSEFRFDFTQTRIRTHSFSSEKSREQNHMALMIVALELNFL